MPIGFVEKQLKTKQNEQNENIIMTSVRVELFLTIASGMPSWASRKHALQWKQY